MKKKSKISGKRSRSVCRIVISALRSRLEVAKNCPDDLAAFLLNEFGLDEDYLYRVNGPVNMVRLSEIFNFVKTPSLYFPPYQASVNPDAENNGSLFDILKKKGYIAASSFPDFQNRHRLHS